MALLTYKKMNHEPRTWENHALCDLVSLLSRWRWQGT